MQVPDPYEPTPPFVYECAECGARTRADTHPGTCDRCNGELWDVSVPRE